MAADKKWCSNEMTSLKAYSVAMPSRGCAQRLRPRVLHAVPDRVGALAMAKRARGDDAELFWAARFGRVGQLRELLQRGAALDSVDPSHGHTALTAAASAVCGLAQPHHANTATREG